MGPSGASMPIQPPANLPFTRVLNSRTYTFMSFCDNLSNSTHDRKAQHIRYGKLATLTITLCKGGMEAEGEFLQ